MLLMSIHNKCFLWRKRKIFTWYHLLSRAVCSLFPKAILFDFYKSQKGLPLETKNTQNHENRRLGLIESLHMRHCSLRGCMLEVLILWSCCTCFFRRLISMVLSVTGEWSFAVIKTKKQTTKDCLKQVALQWYLRGKNYHIYLNIQTP